MKHA